jgi:hypothetical protein
MASKDGVDVACEVQGQLLHRNDLAERCITRDQEGFDCQSGFNSQFEGEDARAVSEHEVAQRRLQGCGSVRWG